MRRNLTYKNVVSELMSAVPEFRETSENWDQELPYDVFGSFALYLCRVIGEPDRSDKIIASSIEFLQDMAHSNDDDVVTLLVVGVLEVIADDQTCTAFIRSKMDSKTSSLFDDVEVFWRPDS